MPKKKKKSKKSSRKTDDDSSPAAPVSSSSMIKESDALEISPAKAKEPYRDNEPELKSPQRKKKRQREEAKPETKSPAAEEDATKNPPKKKRKKKKKNQKQELEDQGANAAADSSGVIGSSDPSPTLEGCILDDMMLFIDKKGGKVYSATEMKSDGSGDRKEVGKIGDDGEIILFEKPPPGKPYSRTTFVIACIEAGWDVFPSSLFGQISCKSISLQGWAKMVYSCLPIERRVWRLNRFLTEAFSISFCIFVFSTETSQADFPFETDPDDHCESPLEAYKDIVPLLNAMALGFNPPSSLSVYDPYYCNGRVKDNLESLGFPNVYNRKEDCYQVWASPSQYPSHDILITNPPYSCDHIEKLINHITSPAFGNRPWMLLLPQWVHKKDYFLAKTKHIRPLYLIPKRRYIYLPPPSFREAKKSDVHKKSSPFVSMWYIWGGTMDQNERWMSAAQRIDGCEVARSKSALRDLRRKGGKKK